MVIAISIVLIITSMLMVLLVLLHKGKGGGLSDLFGGGVSSSLGSSSTGSMIRNANIFSRWRNALAGWKVK